MSGAPRRMERISSRVALSATKALTASSRCAICALSVNGAASLWARSREPAGVTVQSIASKSEPRRSPARVRVNSRLARVAGSIAMVVPTASRDGGDNGGRFPTCVRSI